MITAGIDEAGRGPVIGPMVMAIACIDTDRMQQLKDLGVKDSKLLSPKKRNILFSQIKQVVDAYAIIIVSPQEIDTALNEEGNNLNLIEARVSAQLISRVRCDQVILDCPSTNPVSYTDQVRQFLTCTVSIIAENRADVNYPIVSAASILAKVTRDREIAKLHTQCGHDFGSGYPSDKKTIEFLRANHDKYDFFRKTWASYRNVTHITLDNFK